MIFYKINDGRVYSPEIGAFVDHPPDNEDAIVTTLYDYSDPENIVPGGKERLRDVIVEFQGRGLPYLLADELKNRLDKIQDTQAEYAPRLTALQEAYASAQMLGNDETEEFQQEYKQLLREMQEKIQGVPND